VFQPYEEAAASASKQEAWAELSGRLFNLVTRYGGVLAASASDVFNLLTYSADLGPTAAAEAASVEGFLAQAGVPRYDISQTGVVIPQSVGGLSPDFGPTSGALETVTIPGTRVGTDFTPSPVPYLEPLADRVQPGALPRVSTGTALARAPGLAPRAQAGTLSAIGLIPQIGLPSRGFFRAPDPSLNPFADPYGETSPGTQPTNIDCQTTKTQDKKDKKKQKKKQRNVCHRGTYVELKSGLLKFKKATIPCR
jgi:hypothetical protein